MYIESWVLWLCGVILFAVFGTLTIWALATLDKVGNVREKLRYTEEARDKAWAETNTMHLQRFELDKAHADLKKQYADLSRQHEALIDALIDALKKGKK